MLVVTVVVGRRERRRGGRGRRQSVVVVAVAVVVAEVEIEAPAGSNYLVEPVLRQHSPLVSLLLGVLASRTSSIAPPLREQPQKPQQTETQLTVLSAIRAIELPTTAAVLDHHKQVLRLTSVRKAGV